MNFCEECKKIPEEKRQNFFKLVFGKTHKCPKEENIICFYSKKQINWEQAIKVLKDHEREYGKISV